jgi:hypothetical protein
MHRDSGCKAASQLARYELAGAHYELTGKGCVGTLDRLLRGQLRKLLGDQVVILRELLQQLVTRDDLLLDVRLLRPGAEGLSCSIRQERLLCRELLRGQLMCQELLHRMLLQSCLVLLLLRGLLPVRRLRQTRNKAGRLLRIALLRITVRGVGEGLWTGASWCAERSLRAAERSLRAEVSLRIKAALRIALKRIALKRIALEWIALEGLRAESSLGIKITLWIKHN